MNLNFAYIDEEDKCYGMTGTVLSLYVWDQNDAVREINLDADEALSLAPSFWVCLNPCMSAKAAWKDMVEQYKIVMGMSLSNIMCRLLVHRNKYLDSKTRDDLYQMMQTVGCEHCSLEPDETNALFNKTYNYLSSLYANRQVTNAARLFAQTLAQRRVMSGREIEEELARCLRR